MTTAFRSNYLMIGAQQLSLPLETQRSLFARLEECVQAFQAELLETPASFEWLLSKWAGSKGPASRFSAKYNTSIRGHNIRLSAEVDRAFERVKVAGPQALASLRLSHRVLLHEEAMAIFLAQRQEEALALADEIQTLRTTLLRCVLQLVAEIAMKTYSRNRVNGTLDYVDYFQEGAAAAFEATMAFDCRKNTKWSSFCYTWVTGSLARFVAESSRLVTVPRYVVERLTVVYKAKDASPSAETGEVCEIANRLKAAASPLFSMEEVESLLGIGGTSAGVPAEESQWALRSSSSPLDTLVAKEVGKAGARIMDLLPEDQALVLALRWGLDTGEPRSYESVAESYTKATGKRLSKEKAEELDCQARAALAKDETLRSLWED